MTYEVKRGDTLSSVAARYRTTVASLKAWNGLKSDRLMPGARLTIFAPRDGRPPAALTRGRSSCDGSPLGTRSAVSAVRFREAAGLPSCGFPNHFPALARRRADCSGH